MFDKIFEKFKRFLKALFNRVQISTSKRSQLEYWVPGLFFSYLYSKDLTPAHIHEIFFKMRFPVCICYSTYYIVQANLNLRIFHCSKLTQMTLLMCFLLAPFAAYLEFPSFSVSFVSCTSLTSTGGIEFAKKNQKVPVLQETNPNLTS